MSHRGPWGCFLDIPRTRSNWVKKSLEPMGKAVQSGVGHGLPDEYIKEEFIFTFVREPAYWLRSFWSYHNSRKWRKLFNPGSGDPWAMVTNALYSERSDSWTEFAKNVAFNRAGVVGWFFGLYTTDWVRWEKTEESKEFLNLWFGIREFPEPQNVSVSPPKMDGYIRELIVASEYKAYKKYGYATVV